MQLIKQTFESKADNLLSRIILPITELCELILKLCKLHTETFKIATTTTTIKIAVRLFYKVRAVYSEFCYNL